MISLMTETMSLDKITQSLFRRLKPATIAKMITDPGKQTSMYLTAVHLN